MQITAKRKLYKTLFRSERLLYQSVTVSSIVMAGTAPVQGVSYEIPQGGALPGAADTYLRSAATTPALLVR
jgi:hypothetical protein